MEEEQEKVEYNSRHAPQFRVLIAAAAACPCDWFGSSASSFSSRLLLTVEFPSSPADTERTAKKCCRCAKRRVVGVEVDGGSSSGRDTIFEISEPVIYYS